MSDLTTPEHNAISPSAHKLAERYGVSPEVMEEIISDTRSRAEVRRITPVEAPIPVAPQSVVPKPAAPQPIAPETQAGAVQTSAVPPQVATAQVASAQASPQRTPTAVEVRTEDRENPLSAVTVILIILLIIALIGLIFLWQSQKEPTPKKLVTQDTVQTQPLPPPVDTTTMVEDAPPPPIAPPVVKHRATTRRAHRTPANKYYTTSSMLGAQERLAELRANGNTSAYLETVNKGDNTYYRLHPSRSSARHRRRR